MPVPNGPGPQARETGSPTQAEVRAYGGPAGDASFQRPKPKGWGDGESCQIGCWCLRMACGGGQFPTARAHKPQRPAVLPRRPSVPRERLRGMAAPNGPGLQAGGTGSPAKVAAGAYGVPVGDSRSQRTGPTSWGRGVLPRWRSVPMEGLHGTPVPNGPGPLGGGTGNRAKTAVGAYGGPAGNGGFQRPGPTTSEDGEFCLDGDRCLWRAYGERQFPTAQAHQLGGRGVLLGRRLVPMKDLRGRRFPTARAHKPGGTGSPV